MTFIQRNIDVRISLGSATFDAAGSNVVDISGHRVSCSITTTVGPASGEARIKIYGLQPSIINQVASLNQSTAAAQANTVQILAGDPISGMALAFQGNIVLAQADYSEQPDTTLNLMAFGAGLQALQSIPPTSYPNGADAGVMLQKLAAQGALQYLNYGASRILANPYFVGSVKQQIDDICAAAGFTREYDKGVLVVWPKGQQPGGPQCLISPDTGLVSYPSYTSTENGGGIAVTSTFNPQIVMSSPVQVQSSLQVANGIWIVYSVSHEIESQVPNGQWFTHVVCNR